MRKLFCLLIILCLIVMPVSAAEFTAPEAPDSAQDLMPVEQTSFAQDAWQIIKSAVSALEPSLAEAGRSCLSLFAVVMLTSVLQCFSEGKNKVIELVAVLAIGTVLLQRTGTLIQLGVETVNALSEYGKLLLPVMTAALAAQGGSVTSAALYTGTAVFNTVLTSAISGLMVPMVYVYLALSVANGATGEEVLKNIRDFVKWLMAWFLKIILYIFTGYMGITGVVSGTVDAAAVKATKLTISGMVPVVGGILSDASEAVIVGAGVMKSAAGVYGLLAMIAIWVSPFLQIGLQYLLLKATAAVCAAFDEKRVTELVQCFSSAMGILLAMTAVVCVLLMISTVCFMKGAG